MPNPDFGKVGVPVMPNPDFGKVGVLGTLAYSSSAQPSRSA
jgi:hypothetical protein